MPWSIARVGSGAPAGMESPGLLPTGGTLPLLPRLRAPGERAIV
jgi:hypothetical protein